MAGGLYYLKSFIAKSGRRRRRSWINDIERLFFLPPYLVSSTGENSEAEEPLCFKLTNLPWPGDYNPVLQLLRYDDDDDEDDDFHCFLSFPNFPTAPFTIPEPQDLEIGDMYVVKERRTTDFETLNL